MLEKLKGSRALRFAGLIVVTYLLIGSGLAITVGEQRKHFVHVMLLWPKYIKTILDVLRHGL